MQLNPKELYEIAHSSPTAEVMFTAWACRERNRSRLDIRKFRKYLVDEKVNMNETEFQDTLKKIEAAGAAKIRRNIGGIPVFLEWHANVKEVGLLGIEGDKAWDRVEGKVKAPRLRLIKRPVPKTETAVRPLAVQTILAVPVSGGKMFLLNMPDNLTDGDLSNIAAAVKAAPIRKA